MKSIIVNVDYSFFSKDDCVTYIFFYVGDKLIFEDKLEIEREDLNKGGKKVKIPMPLIYSKTFELEDDEELVISFDSREELEIPFWGETIAEYVVTNFYIVISAWFAVIKKMAWKGQFLSQCYNFAKRYRLKAKGDAVFDFEVKPYNKQYPIVGMKCQLTGNAEVEEFFRKCNFEKDYAMHKKATIINCIILMLILIISQLIAILFNFVKPAAVFDFWIGLSLIFYPTIYPRKSSKEFKRLKESGFDLEAFVNPAK